jgi:hypothetical protein
MTARISISRTGTGRLTVGNRHLEAEGWDPGLESAIRHWISGSPFADPIPDLTRSRAARTGIAWI